MALSESMEIPPTAGRTPGQIAVFSNSYARLPEHFFARLAPMPVAKPHLIKFNDALASELGVNTQGLDPDRTGGDVCRQRHTVGRRADRDGLCRASVRQFRSSAWRRPRNPPRRSLGPQRRAARCPAERLGTNAVLAARRRPRRIGPVLREYLVSEAMHALGIPTTRALAAVSSGEPVYRDRQLPGAVLTRVAVEPHPRRATRSSARARRHGSPLNTSPGYVIDRHSPRTGQKRLRRPILALLQIVVERQALLVARWDACRFHPWGDEHRQHSAFWRDD